MLFRLKTFPKLRLILQVIPKVIVIVLLQVDIDRCRYMKNVTITLSNDILQVLDSICKDCDLSRYAFAKEALLEKIERYSKNTTEKQEEKTEPEKKIDISPKEEKSEPGFLDFLF
jgi:hypothetical protein